jgi:signal transduction histidine kinase
MFLLARADSGGVHLEISKFYLDELLSSCVRAARLLAQPQHITIEEDETLESLCSGDESLVRQAIMILLDNAIKYSGENAVVRVSLRRTRNGVQDQEFFDIGVSDSGPGIPEELQGRVFERLFRIDKTRSRSAADAGGAGLGLPIARWIATVHGGALNLLSSGESGCVFRLRLPACSQPVP